MTQVPEYLYKFVSDIGAAKAMLGGSMKFTKIDDLNDPTELMPWFNGEKVKQSLHDLRNREITEDDLADIQRQERLGLKLAQEMMTFPAPTSISQFKENLDRTVYDNPRTMENHLYKTLNNIRSRTGILSLTERWQSLAMWAHYAANATGFCVVLRDLKEAFRGDGTGVLNAVMPVEYAEQRPAVTFESRTDKNLFFSKLSDWEPEKEWRVVQAIEECELVDGVHHVRKINPDYIVGAICGWKTPAPTIKRLMTQVKEASPHAQIWQAAVDGSGRMTKACIA